MVQDRGVVLIVDDDEDIRDSLREVLEDQGFTAVMAADGQEALERLRESDRPCLILLDLMMPVMDGYKFKQALDADPDLSAIPVVVLTAGKSLPPPNVAAVIRKPMVVEAVLRSVRELC